MENLLDKYLTLVEDYKFSPRYNRFAFLAAVSACLERKAWLYENALGFLYPNLYVLFVGPPASRKTTSAKLPVDLFLKGLKDPPRVCSNQLTPASLIDELQESGKDHYNHKTSPLFAISGEFGVFFKDIGGGSMVDLLLDFYDGRSPGELWKKNTKKWGKQELNNPALTLLGCTTPKEIIQSRIIESAGVGFVSRVIFVCEPQFIPGATRFPPIDAKLQKAIAAEFERINAIEGRFTLGAGAEDTNEQIMIRVNEWILAHPGTAIMASYMARKPTQVRKLAMLFSAMRNSMRIILPEDLLAAEALLTETEATLASAFGLQIQYRDPGLATKILEKVPMTGITAAQLLSAFALDGQAITNDPEFKNVLDGLLYQGVIKTGRRDNDVCYFKA